MDTMQKTRFYEKKKRNRIDYCNICGIESELTYDHVPPKCCFNDMKVSPIEKLSGEQEKFNPNCTQNGLKYRTICGLCNNGILAKYDKSIEDVVEQIKSFLINNDQLNHSTINLSIRVNAFAKSICGHFLAMKNYYDKNCLIDIALREYVLSPSSLPPKDYQLLMRFYPYSTIFSLRDAVIANMHKTLSLPNGVISTLSAFPLSFILNQGNNKCEFIDVFKYCSNNIEDVVEIQLDLKSAFYLNTNVLRHEKWPCNISDDSFGIPALLCSSSAVQDSVFGNRTTDDIFLKMKPKKQVRNR